MFRSLLALFLISSLLSFSVAARAAEEVGGPSAHTVGQWRVYRLTDGAATGKAALFVDTDPNLVQTYLPDGTYPTAIQYFLLRGHGKTILIDTGLGKNLARQLAEAGIKPEAIDAILLTHMHGDHIGGLLTADQAVFPDATIYLSEKEKAYWIDPKMMAKAGPAKKDNFLLAQRALAVYGDRVKTFFPSSFAAGGATLLPTIKAIAAYGHTPGHSMFLLEDGSDKLLFWGDLTHAMAMQMPAPQVAMVYDINPKEAVATRLAVLRHVAAQKLAVAGMHIPDPAIGHLRAAGAGYVFMPEGEK
ncbi:MAG: MBL fold metallo-hydrolase [Desulfobulbaceae bacterium]|jgi:glyoxylase-like metal-dependent hydrolase (beta-lactamase superfamily II)|nr:MBL fold metallo-hydrolase [Desulfobulbaceae bacterium]